MERVLPCYFSVIIDVYGRVRLAIDNFNREHRVLDGIMRGWGRRKSFREK
jgi:hypothetical protein